MSDLALDPASGLPLLPKGYFFRVKKGAFGVYPWVEIRHKIWFFSEEVSGRWTSYHFDTVEEEISYLAGALAKEFYERLYLEGTQKRLAGDYPPKRLEPHNGARG
jgi:hypothetical protein